MERFQPAQPLLSYVGQLKKMFAYCVCFLRNHIFYIVELGVLAASTSPAGAEAAMFQFGVFPTHAGG